MRIPATWIAGGVLTAVALAGSTLAGTRAQRGSTEIPSPSQFVPFRASILVTAPDKQPLSGVHYRGSDASLREDLWTDDPAGAKVLIVNLAASMVYMRTEGGKWFSRVLRSSPENARTPRRPPRFRRESRGLSRAKDSYEGLETYVLRQGETKVHLIAPALNFESLRDEDLQSGEVRLLYDLQIGEVNSSVFEPPPGAEVTRIPGVLDPMAAAKRAVQGRPNEPAATGGAGGNHR